MNFKNTNKTLKLVLSVGDESGIGPEIILKALYSPEIPKNIDLILVDLNFSTVLKKFSSEVSIYSKNSLKNLLGNSVSYFSTKYAASSLVIFSFLTSCEASYVHLPIPNLINVV